MKLKELQDVADEAQMMTHMCSLQIRRDRCDTPEEHQKLLWIIGHCTVLHDELEEHIQALEGVLQVCQAVTQGRYLEDWQRCTHLSSKFSCDYACVSKERCDGFDEREPHAVIADVVSDLTPFSEALRGWILSQLELQRSRRGLLFGPDGLFGEATVQMYQTVGDELVPLGEQAAGEFWADHHAKADTQNESMALCLDQYELNLLRTLHLCEVKSDLLEIAALITERMPPHVRPEIVLS